MNQTLLAVLRTIGVIVFFPVATAIIGVIPDVLTQVPVIGPVITPLLGATLTAAALAWEHNLALKWGYNLPSGYVKTEA